MMELEMRAIKSQERLYTYKQSQQISMQTGLIGYLRADFGRAGEGFHSSWNDFRADLKTEDFKAELDEVINSLREPGELLHSRKDMTSVLLSMGPGYAFQNDRNEYGVRVNTEGYAYLLRLTPRENDYNLYCYCYRRDWLDQHMKQAEKGIRFIDSDYKEKFRLADGDMVRIITAAGKSYDHTVRYTDDCHVEIGQDLYHICEFAERMERNSNTVIPLRSSLPEKCYSTLLDTGAVVILKRGETGFYKTDIPFSSKEEAQALVDEYNKKLGVTKAQAEAMKAGSMFGWACPAADPKNYDDQGQPIKPRHRNRGDAR